MSGEWSGASALGRHADDSTHESGYKAISREQIHSIMTYIHHQVSNSTQDPRETTQKIRQAIAYLGQYVDMSVDNPVIKSVSVPNSDTVHVSLHITLRGKNEGGSERITGGDPRRFTIAYNGVRKGSVVYALGHSPDSIQGPNGQLIFHRNQISDGRPATRYAVAEMIPRKQLNNPGSTLAQPFIYPTYGVTGLNSGVGNSENLDDASGPVYSPFM